MPSVNALEVKALLKTPPQGEISPYLSPRSTQSVSPQTMQNTMSSVTEPLADTSNSPAKTSSAMPRYADGGEISPSLPPGFEMESTSAAPSTPQDTSGLPSGFEMEAPPQDNATDQAKAFAEAAGRGVIGPLAPKIETTMFGVKPEDIRQRQTQYPITSGLGEATGFGVGAYFGAGLPSAIGKVGAAAKALTGVAENAPLIARVGSSIVQNAAEMAVLSGSDEVSKKILQDPESSSESAIANIGLSAAIGGIGGAVFTGAISPLWKATAGPKVEGFLNGLKKHLDNDGMAVLPGELKAAEDTLGIDTGALIRGANQSPELASKYNQLKSVQTPEIKATEEALHKNVSESVMNSVGTSPEALQNYDTATAGRAGMESFKEEYKAKSAPIIKEFNDLTEPFKNAEVLDNHVADSSDRIVKLAQEKGYLGQDVPQQKLVDAALTRMPQLKTAEDVKRLITTVGNIASDNYPALGRASHEIKGILLDMQQNVLGSAIKTDAPDLFDKYQAARKGYAGLAKLSDRIGGELGIGKFEGPETFLKTLESKRSPEEFFKRLSPENNAELLPIMQQHFPATTAFIRDNELRKIVAPAVKAAKGDLPINVKTLNAAIKSKMAGQQAYTQWALPKELISKADAAETIMRAIPVIKDSGTSGWIEKNSKTVPATALSLVAAVTGRNPFFAGMAGHLGQYLRREGPDAVNLALLKFAGANEPIKAEGFKSMVNYFSSVYKGENTLANAAANVFKRTGQVLTSEQMPNKADRDKLDNVVTDSHKDPNLIMNNHGQSHLGHYLPLHQTATVAATTNAIQYLQKLQPKPLKIGILGKEIQPSTIDIARYQRALGIAQQPAIVLQYAKDGTLKASDMADLFGMFPAYSKNVANTVSNIMAKHVAKGESVPYETRMGLSLLLGQPLDATLSPASILAAQATYAPKTPTAPNQGTKVNTPKNISKLGKTNSSYKTPLQEAEGDRANRH